jgi:hypothetical protein
MNLMIACIFLSYIWYLGLFMVQLEMTRGASGYQKNWRLETKGIKLVGKVVLLRPDLLGGWSGKPHDHW